MNMKILYGFSLFFLFLVLINCSNTIDKSPEIGSVASAHPLATKAGLDVLKDGGNAFDAAIAVAAALNVVEPMMSGIGGYGTILIYGAEQKSVKYLNPSGRFPENTNSDLMRSPTPDFMKNRVGPKSISTPGNLNAWEDMHKKYGSKDWNILFDAAINYAENGFRITSSTARWIDIAFEDFNEYAQTFYGLDGEPLKKGEQLIQLDLGKTYRQIAKEGAAPFYHGNIAAKIDRQMKEVGSFLSLKDLQMNKAEWWAPIKFNYRGYDVYTAGLPANSFPAFVNLGLMQQWQPKDSDHNSLDYLHRFAEITKESYKARLAYSFDPDIRISPIDSILANAFLKSMAKSLDMTKASDFVPPYLPESKNTTHFVVIDKWGNIVSATQTLGNLFGSRIMVEGTGIWLNNSMAYASFEPKGNPMDAFPGRHKLSGDCPVIILKDNRPWAALGSPGGHTITQNVPQIIMNLIDFEMSMQEAIDAPKIAFVEPNSIRVDSELDKETIDALISHGHRIIKGNIGNATGIRIIYSSEGEIIHLDQGIDKRGEGRAAIIDN